MVKTRSTEHIAWGNASTLAQQLGFTSKDEMYTFLHSNRFAPYFQEYARLCVYPAQQKAKREGVQRGRGPKIDQVEARLLSGEQYGSDKYSNDYPDVSQWDQWDHAARLLYRLKKANVSGVSGLFYGKGFKDSDINMRIWALVKHAESNLAPSKSRSSPSKSRSSPSSQLTNEMQVGSPKATTPVQPHALKHRDSDVSMRDVLFESEHDTYSPFTANTAVPVGVNQSSYPRLPGSNSRKAPVYDFLEASAYTSPETSAHNPSEASAYNLPKTPKYHGSHTPTWTFAEDVTRPRNTKTGDIGMASSDDVESQNDSENEVDAEEEIDSENKDERDSDDEEGSDVSSDEDDANNDNESNIDPEVITVDSDSGDHTDTESIARIGGAKVEFENLDDADDFEGANGWILDGERALTSVQSMVAECPIDFTGIDLDYRFWRAFVIYTVTNVGDNIDVVRKKINTIELNRWADVESHIWMRDLAQDVDSSAITYQPFDQEAERDFDTAQSYFDNIAYQREDLEESCNLLGIPWNAEDTIFRMAGMAISASFHFWQPVAVKGMWDIYKAGLVRACILGDGTGIGKTWEVIGFLLMVRTEGSHLCHMWKASTARIALDIRSLPR